MNLQQRSDDNPINPDHPLRAINTPVTNEVLKGRLRSGMKTMVEVHCAEGHEFGEISAMLRSLVLEVYTAKYKTQTRVSEKLNINRGTIRSWLKELEAELNDIGKLTDEEIKLGE